MTADLHTHNPNPALKWVGAILGLVLVAAVVAVYAKTVHGPFIFDDVPYVVDRPHSHLPDLSWDSIARLLAVKTAQPHRWLSHLSFALNYRFFGESPASFRVTNIVIHLLTTLGVFLLSRKSLALLGWQASRAGAAATAAAFLFALHPIQTQSVSYVWQRTASLVTLWTVWSVWFFAVARSRPPERGGGYYGLCAVCVAAAVLTKQNGILVPFLILFYNYMFFTDRSRHSAAKHAGILAALIVAGLVAVTFLWRSWGWAGLLDYGWRDYSMGERLLTQGRVMWRYVELLAVPWPGWLNIDHHVVPSTGLLSPWTTLPALLAVAAGIGFSVWCIWRAPAVGFGLLWYWAAHMPEGTIIPLELMFEHRCYMPLVGLAFVGGAGFDALRRRFGRVGYGALAATCVLYAAGTWVRNGVYLDEETLWRDAVAKSPRKARPHNNLARIVAEAGNVQEAMALYRKSIELNPKDSGTYNVLGMMLAQAGRPAEAVDLYRQSIAIKHDTPGTYNNLGLALMAMGRVDEAVDAFREAIRHKETFADAHHGLGNALARKGDLDGAERAFREALRLDRLLGKAYINLSAILIGSERFAEAEALLSIGAGGLPDDADVQNALARFLIACPDGRFRNVQEGIARAAKQCARTNREHALLLVTLAMGLAERGDFPGALRTAREAMQVAANQGRLFLASQIQNMVDAYQQGRKPEPEKPPAPSTSSAPATDKAPKRPQRVLPRKEPG